MADQVSPLGGLSAGMVQSIKTATVPSQPRPSPSVQTPDPGVQPGSLGPAEDGKDKSVDEKALETAAKAVDEYLQQSSPDLQFFVDKETGMYCVKVVDSENQELIRQVPSEEALKMAKRLREMGSTSGVLMDSEG